MDRKRLVILAMTGLLYLASDALGLSAVHWVLDKLFVYVAVAIRQEYVLLIMSGVFLAEIGSVTLQVGYFNATKGKRIFKCAPYHWHLHRSGWPASSPPARRRGCAPSWPRSPRICGGSCRNDVRRPRRRKRFLS